MKRKLFAIVSSAAAVLLLAGGCQSNPDDGVVAGERTLRLATSAEAESGSRAVYVDMQGISWEDSDINRLGVTSNVQDAGGSTGITIGADGRATFTAVVAPPATDLLTYYPWDEGRRKVLEVDNGTKLYRVGIEIPAAQSQSEAGRGDMRNAVLFGAHPIHIGDGADAVQSPTVENPMIFGCAILRFRIYDSAGTYSGEALRGVEVKAGDGAAVSATAIATGNIAASESAPEIAFEGGANSCATTLGMVSPLSGIISAESAHGIYVAVAAFESSDLTYTVTTTAATYAFRSTSAKSFGRGKIYDIMLNLSNGSAEREEIEGGGGEIEHQLLFTYQDTRATHTFNSAGDGVFMNGAIVSLMLDGVDVKDQMTADNSRLAAEYESGVAWLTEVRFQNTDNFQWHVTAGLNPTTAERHAKVYLYFNNIKSTNFIEFHQEAGMGGDYVAPALEKLHEAEIAADGETVAAAARLTLSDFEGTALDIAKYRDQLTIACTNDGEAALADDGTVKVVFPANEAASRRTFTLTVTGTHNQSASVQFTQAGKPGGNEETHNFEYTLFTNAADGSKGTGFGPDAYSGDWYRFENITIDGTYYTPADLVANTDLANALMAHAFEFGTITADDVQVPGFDPLTENPEEFVTLEPRHEGAAVYVRIVLTQNTTGARRTFKIITRDGSGGQLTSVVYFQNP